MIALWTAWTLLISCDASNKFYQVQMWHRPWVTWYSSRCCQHWATRWRRRCRKGSPWNWDIQHCDNVDGQTGGQKMFYHIVCNPLWQWAFGLWLAATHLAVLLSCVWAYCLCYKVFKTLTAPFLRESTSNSAPFSREFSLNSAPFSRELRLQR